jgi:hypothetical protein
MTTPKHNREPGPGDDEGDLGAGGRTGAERSSPAPALNEPQPVRQPVSFAQVDVRDAIDIATTAIKAAAEIVGDIDPFTYTQLTAYLVEEISSGRAADGVQVTSACTATRTARGHLPELYTERWELTSQLAVRLTAVMTGRSVRFEELYVHPAEISRDHHGLGMDHHRGARQAMHFAGLALGTTDSQTTAAAIPLLIGTRDDVCAPTADLGRINDFAKARGRSLPGSWGEHAAELLMMRRQVGAALRGRPELGRLLQPFGLTVGDVYRGFAATLVVRAMPFGPPRKRTMSSAGVLVPTHEDGLMALLGRLGGRSLVFAGSPTAAATRAPTPEELARRGYRDVPWDAGQLGDSFGLGRIGPWNVEYRYSHRAGTLIRLEAGEGAWMEAWRLLGFRESDLTDALALVERSREDWPRHCLDRAYIACAPGKLKTQDLRSQNAWRSMLRVADAALVAADRLMRQRHARS